MNDKPRGPYEEAKTICKILIEAGYPTMFAGGCVRDRLSGLVPKDYDLATTALPKTACDLLEQAGKKVFPVGIEHGTIGVLTDTQTVEVTTLRTDSLCDGRRAQVDFTRSFEEDAKRRDFTINGIFEDIDGRIHDYVRGYRDLTRKHLRFIGEPKQRIREDYLRILRYFRFLARLGWAADGAALEAISSETPGLRQLASERILREFDLLLIQPFAEQALQVADETRSLQTLFAWYHSTGLTHFGHFKGRLDTPSPDTAWFFFLWHCGPKQTGPWLKREMEKLRFPKSRRLWVSSLFDFFLKGVSPIEGYTILMKMAEQPCFNLTELKALMQCSPEEWKPGLVARYQTFLDRMQGTPPELLRKDILSLPITERSQAILVAKIFWYLGWCGGKTPLRTVLLNFREFRPWLESEALVPPPIAMWGEA